jgi:hypothetical protein
MDQLAARLVLNHVEATLGRGHKVQVGFGIKPGDASDDDKSSGAQSLSGRIERRLSQAGSGNKMAQRQTDTDGHRKQVVVHFAGTRVVEATSSFSIIDVAPKESQAAK